jgi:hypothetical protein
MQKAPRHPSVSRLHCLRARLRRRAPGRTVRDRADEGNPCTTAGVSSVHETSRSSGDDQPCLLRGRFGKGDPAGRPEHLRLATLPRGHEPGRCASVQRTTLGRSAGRPCADAAGRVAGVRAADRRWARRSAHQRDRNPCSRPELRAFPASQVVSVACGAEKPDERAEAETPPGERAALLLADFLPSSRAAATLIGAMLRLG